MSEAFRVALIGGTSHAGKSTTARAVAARLGGEAVSTDSLGPHPGRPWPVGQTRPPPHVVAHYRTLSTDELVVSVLAHYRHSIWPLVRTLVSEHDETAPPLVFEGSALLPDLVATLDAPDVRAVWLIAEPRLIERRIRSESGFDAADPAGRALIEAFIARAVRFDALVRDDARRLGLTMLEITPDTTEQDAADAVIQALCA